MDWMEYRCKFLGILFAWINFSQGKKDGSGISINGDYDLLPSLLTTKYFLVLLVKLVLTNFVPWVEVDEMLSFVAILVV